MFLCPNFAVTFKSIPSANRAPSIEGADFSSPHVRCDKYTTLQLSYCSNITVATL
ncbi:hypothetical protein Scep_020505 [Stephania cephalantha]|uniref:Uncharacterized protein n=1 Tax=Stephania cephalantha TaxID=152367 RepID=A0AAP0ICR5_9MAGN